MKELNNIKVIEKIEQNIGNGDYDYLVNWNDESYSDVKIVETKDDIDFERQGWTLWVVKHPDEETQKVIGKDSCLFLQNINNEFGGDHHLLTDEEIENFVIFFIAGNYEINRKGSFWRSLFEN